ncbi:hypothetical protein ES705_09766 [subsurface metagenome]|jgi:hypothetical protein
METTYFKIKLLEAPTYVKLSEFDKGREIVDFATPFLRGIEGFTNCEVIHRRAERAKALQLPKSDYYEKFSELQNNRGMRNIDSAKKSLEIFINRNPQGFEKDIPKDILQEAMDESEIIMKNESFEKDIKPEEAKEIWEEVVKIRKIANEKGTRGLADHLVYAMDNLRKSRIDLDKGRKPASPLVWWKSLAIIGLIGLALFILIFLIWAGLNNPEQWNAVGEMLGSVWNTICDLINRGC